MALQLWWWSTWGRSQGFCFNSNFIYSKKNPLSDWRPYLLISFVLLRLLRFSSARSWSKRRFLSTDYCFPVKIQSREHWQTVIPAFQENGCWWNSVIMSVIMTDAVTEREDSSLLPATALVTPHSAFTQLHQLHQTHFKYVHIEEKNRLLASGKWIPVFAHSCLCSTVHIT